MLKEFFIGLGQLIEAFKIDYSMVIDPKSNDIYCRGMTFGLIFRILFIFGLEGSKMLVKVANIVQRDIPGHVRGKSKTGTILDAVRENASKLGGYIRDEA